MTRKRDVRDARSRDRSPQPEAPRAARPRPTASPAARRPVASPRPVEVDEDDDEIEAPEDPSTPRAWYANANIVVPGILAVLLGWALFERFRPPPRPEGAVAEAGADAGAPSADAAPAAPTPAAPTPAADAGAPAPNAPDTAGLDPSPVNPAHPEPTSPDPRGGRFTLDQATEGLAGEGALHADIVTSMGTFDCELLAQQAPNTVANFVGLARGTREFWDPVAGEWAKRPFYNGSLFHRVIPDFMIQGGDILRSGRGDPGYEIADENVRPHDTAGLLCMANHGANTGGAQFFITETAKPHLDGSYSIFGRCTPTDLVGRIARVDRDATDRPGRPVFIVRVDIRRGARPGA